MTTTDAKGPERITNLGSRREGGGDAPITIWRSEYVRADLYDQLKQELDRLKSAYKVLTFDWVAVEEERDRYRAALEKYAQTDYWIRPRDGSTYREVFITNSHGFEIAIKALNPQEHGGGE